MKKFCSNCGKELSEEANFCLSCEISVSNIVKNGKTNKNAAEGFVLGVCSIFAWLILLFDYPICI